MSNDVANVPPESFHSHHVDEKEIPKSILDKYPNATGQMHIHILKDGTKEVHFNGHPELDHHKK